MKQYKVAMLGAHEIGGLDSSPTLSAKSEKFQIFTMVGIYDSVEKNAETASRFFGVKNMSLEDILNDPEIDIVINCLTPEEAFPVSKQVLEHGKHLVTGKMMGYTLEEGKILYDLAKEKNLRLSCGPDCLLSASMQTARYIVDHGLLGNVNSVVISLSRNNMQFGDTLPYLFTKGGNILYDMGGYYLSSIINILGSVKRISAFGTTTDESHTIRKVSSPFLGEEHKLDDFNILTATLEFENGVLATVHLNSKSVFDQKYIFDIYGEKGILSLGHPHDYNLPVILKKPMADPVEFPLIFGFQEMGQNVGLAELCWSIENNRPCRISAELALHMLEVAYGIEESAKNHQIYEMTTRTERPDALEEGYIGDGFWLAEEETALTL